MPNVEKDEVEKIIGRYFDLEESTSERWETFIGTMYHYTDAAGAVGILSKKQLWLTDILTTNDYSELTYSLDHTKNVINDKVRSIGDKDPMAKVILEQLEESISKTFQTFDFYAACFSKSQDKLSQWRAYARDGLGFAIGLKVTEESYRREPPNNPADDVKVIAVNYSEKILRDTLTEDVETTLNVLKDKDFITLINREDQREGALIILLSAVAAAMITEGILYKHPDFEEESEVRVLLLDTTGKLESSIQVRSSGDRLTPYIPCNLENHFLIESVTVGPTARDDSLKAVEDLLKSHGLGTVSVGRSKIPYRR